jgi:hypothetical protein
MKVILQQLKEEFDGMNKTANRSLYMKKIQDMHKNLSKQRIDIDRVFIYFYIIFIFH